MNTAKTNQFPPEWQLMRVDDLFETTAGGDHNPLRSNDVQDDHYPYPIYANGIEQRGLYGFSNYAEAPAGSITVTGRGALGNAFYRDTPFVAIGRLIVLKPEVALDARFFCEYINYGIEFAVESTGVPQLTTPQISNYLLPVPPQYEQRAIAEVLSDVDGLINALDALIAKKRAIKKATMQQLLTGNTRLYGFSGEWYTKRLGNILSYKRPDAYIVKNTEYSEHGNIPVLTANKAFILGYTDEVFGICEDFPVILFDDFTTDNKFATFPFKVKSSAIKLLYPKHERVSLNFVFERMQLIDYPLGNHKRYYLSEYQNLELPVPDYEEQHAIATVFSDMDAEITALEERKDKTIAIKQGMMQQLLTGKVRLLK